MPGIDSFALDNHGLDGPVTATILRDVTPAMDNLLVPIPSSQTGIFRVIATFPAGTKLISISPTEANSKLAYRINTESTVPIMLALVDSKGVVWQLSPTTSVLTGVSMMTVRIADPYADSVYIVGNFPSGDASKTWIPIRYAKPASFDTETDMTFCVYVNSNNAPSTSNMFVDAKTFRIVSM